MPVVLAALTLMMVSCGGSDDDSSASTSDSSEMVIADAWARTSPAMVTAGAAYVTITSPVDDRLVSASVQAAVAGTVELHETMTATMDTGTMDTGATGATAEPAMEMRAIDGLDLPAGQSVAMTPGGYHLMLLDLAEPLQRDSTFDLTLEFEKAGQRTVTVTVRDDAP